ncbi:MAG: metalloregulator ArsR/SmtB family transcription factor [Desulfobacterales bacterium]|jgi:DNA-binding transcriptional ArsR family regulator
MAHNLKTCSNSDVCDVRVIHAEKIKQAHANVIPDDRLQRLATIYRLLGDPTRLKIVMALKQVEMCVCDIAAFLEMTESAVSHQLRRLRDMAIVKRRRQGQILYYSLSDDLVTAFLEVGITQAG